MKKALATIGMALAMVSIASAQVIQVGGTIGGVPVQIGNQNGGTVIIGSQAQANTNVGGSLLSLLALAQNIVNRLIPFAIGLAVAALFFGLVMFIINGRKGDAAGHDAWLKFMGMSILALFVMVSIWGLVGFIASVFGISVGGNIPVPSIPTGPTS